MSAAIVGATDGSGCSESGVYVGVAVLGMSLLRKHKRYLSQFSTSLLRLTLTHYQRRCNLQKSYVGMLTA